MRLHRLTVTAFGPFGGEETVDFDALASGGLFLLTGPTGAGKTSVLDAVCFALYGSVPGSRGRAARGLRSDHAEAALLTRVELELTLGGRRLLIQRSPEQLRPKQRGAGMTPVKAQTLLSEWSAEDDAWRPRSGSHQEIGQELLDLIGMSRDQFTQVVLLPQGDFARFLQANAQDRRELLGRLFDTRRFGDVEAWLAEHRQRCEKETQAVRTDIAAAVERLHEAAGAPELPAPEPEASGEGVSAWAAALREQAALRHEVASVRYGLVGERRAASQARLREAEALFTRQQEHRRAVEALSALAAEEPEQRSREQRLARAERAASVAPVLRQCAEAEQDAARASAERERAVSALGPDAPEDLRAAERAMLGAVGELRALLDAERRFEAVGEESARAERRFAAAEEAREDAAAWLAGWPGVRAQAQQAVDEARQAAGRRQGLDEKLRAAEERAEAAGRRDALRARHEEARERHLALRGRAAGAQETWLGLKQRRIEGMAAELAARLSPGTPCEVCGATEHPAPAVAAPDQVTPGQERDAEAAFRALEQRATDAGAELARLAAESSAAEARAGSASRADLLAEVAGLRGERDAAERAEAAALAAGQRLDRLEQEHERRAQQLAAAQTGAATAEDALVRLTAERAELDARLAQARAGAPSVAARSAQLERQAAALGRAADAVRAAEAAGRAAEAARTAAARECAAAGFPDAGAARAAALSPAQTQQLREAVEAHTARLARARAQVADPGLTAAAALPAAEVPAAHAADAAAERALLEAHAAERSASARVADLVRLGARLAADLHRLRPFAADLATATELSQLVAGTSKSNELRMSLENYVLAARLEQVAAAAGARLRIMSGGRYTLEHSDARARGNARSGLGLQVLDAWTGLYRDTATLSGGESFFASLALALGLADVVTDEAGGMPLDTLFIDEGFGALDPDTLEEVMSVLDSLRERDRAVGIVSHVSELRDRIPQQLTVHKGRSGSSLSQGR